MKECECLPNCPFFNGRMDEMPASVKMFKRQYCLGNHISCARYRVYKELGLDHVPDDLLPYQSGCADAIIMAKNKAG